MSVKEMQMSIYRKKKNQEEKQITHIHMMIQQNDIIQIKKEKDTDQIKKLCYQIFFFYFVFCGETNFTYYWDCMFPFCIRRLMLLFVMLN